MLESFWDGWYVKNDVLNVRYVFNWISDEVIEIEIYLKFFSDVVKWCLVVIFKNGGFWIDLYKKG